MQNMAFIIRTTVPMMEEKYGFGKTIRKQRDSCDGIFDNGGSIKITVTTVTYRHREDGIR